MRTRIFFKIFLTLNMWLCSSAGICLEWARIRSDSEFFFQAFFLHFLYCISFVKIITSPPKKNVKNNFTNLQTCRGEVFHRFVVCVPRVLTRIVGISIEMSFEHIQPLVDLRDGIKH